LDYNRISIIEASSEAGAGTRGASLGPEALRLESLKRNSGLFEGVDWVKSKHFNQSICHAQDHANAHNFKEVLGSVKESYGLVKANLESAIPTLVLSGDHSNAMAGISALSDDKGADQIGVVWIDAHADLHSPYTTPSGNVHGMPLAAMLNENNHDSQINIPEKEIVDFWEHLKTLGSGKADKIKAAHMVFIAIRDLEKPEWDLIKKHNIKYFEPADITQLGIEEVVKQAKAHIAHLSHWYVSFDVDSIDPTISMGTGTPVALGLTREEAKYCTSSFFNDEKTALFEITEINPLLDEHNKMASFVHELLENLVK